MKGQDTAGGTSTSAYDQDGKSTSKHEPQPSKAPPLQMMFRGACMDVGEENIGSKVNCNFDRKVGLSSGVGEVGRNVVDGSDT